MEKIRFGDRIDSFDTLSMLISYREIKYRMGDNPVKAVSKTIKSSFNSLNCLGGSQNGH